MHADWIQYIERQLAEVPPGCLLSPPSLRCPGSTAPGPTGPAVDGWKPFLCFPASPSPICVSKARPFLTGMPPLDSGLEITHCRRGRVGLGDEGGAHPLSGPLGSLSAPHGLLRPLHPPLSPGILRGLLHLPEPGHPVPGFAARLGPGRRLPPGNSAAVLSPGPPHVSPRADRAGPYFLSALRPAGSPSACLTTR